MPYSKQGISANFPQALLGAALALLARREYSRLELRRKLTGRFPDADFGALFEYLQRHNYQSDRRFAQVFVRSRVQRGQGPLRISRELQQRGIAGDLASGALTQAEVDWFAFAQEQLQRKYSVPIGAMPPDQRAKEYARRQRYLAYRGFPAEVIHWVLGDQ
ncbi:regulatory protein RecX [Microbulbifer spongiae]|uniref:Regulatory protein RecX n=1 Tax=Microbulbifer spongiae TaxID=2944933 RepID=A0ABY9E7R7_9GAMM|nr:regulatory protein RecX [Microbulbifer sp. MI-G]WKD48687.1 recombination regulator RecX [Microbulbifer sp. MI-G]